MNNMRPADLLAIAVINRFNHPLLIHICNASKNSDTNPVDLSYHYLAHIACDYIDRDNEMNTLQYAYLGILFSFNEMTVYGYLTNTGTLFLTIVPTNIILSVKDSTMKQIFESIYVSYLDLICNPFYNLNIDSNQHIDSPKFIRSLDNLIA